ncbi:MAG: hypothetical protein MJB12_07920 [Firmicutes bacterium]|nr:hypothetical protein [Bacillota bacterium]
MRWINSIPPLLSLFSSLLICVVSLGQAVSFRVICLRASITLVVFYIFGLFVRKMCIDMITDIVMKKQKKIEEKKKKKLEADQQQGNETKGEDEFFSPLNVAELGDKEAKIITNQVMQQ